MKNIKKVLIVSLGAGAGHIKAAEAIEKAILAKKKGVKVKTVDFLGYSNIFSKNFYSKWYIDLVKYAPQLYGWLYHSVKPSSTHFRLLFDRFNAQELKILVIKFKPDLVICTHFVPANLFNHWKGRSGFNYKVWLTVTDYEAHPLWVDREVDMNFVATEKVARYLVRSGIDAEKIKITGIPIDLKFSLSYKRKKILDKLGLKNKFTISIFSGGFGMGPLEEILKDIGYSILDINILVVAGKNIELKKKLEVLAGDNKNIKIFGFVNNIEEFMAVSDIIISKPGGLTVSESMAIGTPLLMSNPIPGQEEANVRFMLKNKAGLRADEPEKIVKLIKKVLKNKEILVELKRNLKKISRPRAVLEIIKEIK